MGAKLQNATSRTVFIRSEPNFIKNKLGECKAINFWRSAKNFMALEILLTGDHMRLEISKRYSSCLLYGGISYLGGIQAYFSRQSAKI